MSPITLGILGASGGVSFWAATLRTTPTDTANGFSRLALGSDQSIYLVGTTAVAGNNQHLITKLNPNGGVIWQRRLGDANAGNGTDIALDSSNNLYITGIVNSGRFAKYNSDGVIQFQRLFTSGPLNGVAVDSANNFYVGGSDGTGGHWRKYNSAGTIQWQRRLADNQAGARISTDSSNDIYTTRINTAPNRGKFVKINTSGTQQFTRTIEFYTASGIKVTSSGDIYVTWRDGPSPSTFYMVTKYNSAGTLQWARRIENFIQGDAFLSRPDVDVDNLGNVYAISTGILSTRGVASIIKYDTNGTIQFQRALSIEGVNVIGTGIKVDNQGAMFVSFRLNDPSGGAQNAVAGVAKLPDDGSLTKTFTLGFEFTYAASTYTASTPTLTTSTNTDNQTTPTLTDTAGSLTDAATTLTASAITL